jgi:hypothetical protein
MKDINNIYTGYFRWKSKYFWGWCYGLFRVNKSIETRVKYSVGVEMGLFEFVAYRSDAKRAFTIIEESSFGLNNAHVLPG